MHEIAKVTLENEMDLIMAHKRTMKLAEIAGLSLSAQTTFATAVSEVSRNIIDGKKSGLLSLCVESDQHEKYIVACLKNGKSNEPKSFDGLAHAKKLVNKYNISTKGNQTTIELYYYISPPFKIDIHKLDEWRSLFRNEPPISPYEELKQKNELLQDLADKVQKSETQFKTLTNSLPLIIFSMDNAGQLLYANEWLQELTGKTTEQLNNNEWKTIVHEEEYEAFTALLKNNGKKNAAASKIQARIKNKDGEEYLWHQISLSPLKNDKNEIINWIGYIVDINTQKIYEDTLKDNIELKQTQNKLNENQQALENIIGELNRSNLELQQFAFIASHDLQEPARKLLYYTDYLLSTYKTIDEKGIGVLNTMNSSAKRMRSLIHDLLSFSQINKAEVNFKQVDLNEVASTALQDLEILVNEKNAIINIRPLPTISGDEEMIRQVFENIISNSLKYSKTGIAPQVDISSKMEEGFLVITFKDNGIGFNEKYALQIFTLFQRLHSREIYKGTGLGLAICRKIIELHKGRIWATAAEGEGAIFCISFPTSI
ncbi:sensor histidine kinase [Parasediminibacterium sp. JCM 36343]|uniref:sensor histidine kinase n=1 Tax=Parasediminibacterium sp. JCM 36343 TaxID=3374279 RepID=UPI00397C6FE4